MSYYAQSIDGHLDVIQRRQPIETLLHQSEVSEDLKTRLRLVLEIREFASNTLQLPDNGSYRYFADLPRTAMVWNLVAAPEFGLEPKEWCYLVIGCASYRGYFQLAKARSAAAELALQGWDVSIDDVPAYSTLGWFADPLPSTVIHWPEARIAGLVFHELAHQKLYVNGDSAFNEAFATAVERIGVARWLAERGDRAQVKSWQQSLEMQRAFTELLDQTRKLLVRLYESTVSKDEKRQRKASIFSLLRHRYQELKTGWNGYNGFDRWFDRDLNNAHLASVATYETWVNAFLRILDENDGDLVAFYRESISLADLPYAERRAKMQALNNGQPSL